MINKKIKQLKEKVFEANIELYKSNLVLFTFGNVSGIDENRELVAIKPSGVDYNKIMPDDIVIVSIDGTVVNTSLKPSLDTKTHLELYNSFPGIGGVAHTHSRYATSFAQANTSINCYGTTHADYFLGQIPCTDFIKDNAINKDYEKETGRLIVNTFKDRDIDINKIKGCLVAGHGPFTWGLTPMDSVNMSIVLEEIAQQNFLTKLINPSIDTLKVRLIEKHFYRKHGINSYYGQKY